MKDFDIAYKNITSASHISTVCFLTGSSQNVDINKSVIIAAAKDSSYMYLVCFRNQWLRTAACQLLLVCRTGYDIYCM